MGPVSPALRGESVEYDRGALVERYVTLAASVEQQFMILEPISLAGKDLVIAGSVRSEGRLHRGATGWSWRGGGGAVGLGEVTVRDASGKTLPAALEATATTTRLVVAGAALAAAVYPVLIDPEIGANDFQISRMEPTGSSLKQAVAYNSVNDEYLVVWQGDDIGTEYEIHGQRLDATTGEEIGENDFRISDMGPDGDALYDGLDPAVAYNPANNEYLVVWSGDDVFDEYEIYGQRLDAATGEEIGENDFRISDMGPDGDNDFHAVCPEIAYNVLENEYLVVWHGDDDDTLFASEVYGQRIDAAAGLEVGENDFRISQMGPEGDAQFQAFDVAAAHNSTRNEYLVIWLGNETLSNYEIFAQRLDGVTGAEIGEDDFQISEVPGAGGIFEDVSCPRVAYNPTDDQYLIVWSEETTGFNWEIYGQRLDGSSGEETGEDDFRISDMIDAGETPPNVYGANPDVAYSSEDGEYLVVWNGSDAPLDSGSGESEIYGQRLDAATGAEVGANDFRLTDMGPDGSTTYDAFEPMVAHNPLRNEVLIVWWGDNAVDEDFEIYGQRYLAGLFEDDFEDEEIAPDWTLERGTWTEREGLLVGVPDDDVGTQVKARAIATGFEGCEVCTVEAQLEARNGSGGPAEVHVRLLGWYASRQTNVSVTLKPEQDKVVYRQKEGAVTLLRRDFFSPIEEGISYDVRIAFDGSRFQVLLDSAVIFDEANAGGDLPFGTVGFQSRNSDIAVAVVAAVTPLPE